MKNFANKLISKTPVRGEDDKAFFALAWVCFFWGTTWIASKIGVMHMPALQFVGIRQIFGGLVFVLYFLYIKHPLPKGKEWRTIIILSTLNFIFSNGLVVIGVKYISGGLASIIGAIFPLWVVLINLIRGKKISWMTVIGVLLGFGGVCVIFLDHLNDFFSSDFRLGIIISLIASVVWAMGSMYTKKKASSFNPYFSMGLQMMFAGVVFFIAAYGSSNTIPFSEIPYQSFWAVVYLIIVGSVFTFIAYIYALQRLPTSLTSVYAYINPIVAVLLGAFLLNEKLNIFIAIGGIITLSGVYLVNQSFRKTIKN